MVSCAYYKPHRKWGLDNVIGIERLSTYSHHLFITTRIISWGNRISPICLSICYSYIWTRNLVAILTLINSSPSSMVKVIGQRSRSHGQKRIFRDFSLIEWPQMKSLHMGRCLVCTLCVSIHHNRLDFVRRFRIIFSIWSYITRK